MFFFEKKEPKNFCVPQRHAPLSPTKELKIFCFFSSEKKVFLPFSTAPQIPLSAIPRRLPVAKKRIPAQWLRLWMPRGHMRQIGFVIRQTHHQIGRFAQPAADCGKIKAAAEALAYHRSAPPLSLVHPPMP
jgi:hypothetical protein